MRGANLLCAGSGLLHRREDLLRTGRVVLRDRLCRPRLCGSRRVRRSMRDRVLFRSVRLPDGVLLGSVGVCDGVQCSIGSVCDGVLLSSVGLRDRVQRSVGMCRSDVLRSGSGVRRSGRVLLCGRLLPTLSVLLHRSRGCSGREVLRRSPRPPRGLLPTSEVVPKTV